MVERLLMEALALLQKPVSRLTYSGKATTYFTFQSIYSQPSGYSDDRSTYIEHTLRVHLFSNIDYSALLSTAIGVLEDAGFTVEGVDAEMYEENTGFYHIPITIRIMEEKQDA